MHGGLFLSGRPPVGGLRVRGCLLGARYGSITTVQVYVPGSRSVAGKLPSPLVPVEPLGPAGVQLTVEAVPPSTCELMLTVTSVSGVLWNLTVSPTYGLSEQAAVLSTVFGLASASTWYSTLTLSGALRVPNTFPST